MSYANVVHRNPAAKLLEEAYKRLDEGLYQAEKYYKNWLSYQSLWKIDLKKVTSDLGDDIGEWKQLLEEIKAGRSTFDNSDSNSVFGSIVIDYRLVQN